MKIALITACLAGLAHSKMAAVAMEKEAKRRKHEIVIEEQGGHKIPVKLTQAQIDEADVIIVAKAVSIAGKDRLNGKKVLEVNINRVLRDVKGTMDKAEKLFKQG